VPCAAPQQTAPRLHQHQHLHLQVCCVVERDLLTAWLRLSGDNIVQLLHHLDVARTDCPADGPALPDLVMQCHYLRPDWLVPYDKLTAETAMYWREEGAVSSDSTMEEPPADFTDPTLGPGEVLVEMEEADGEDRMEEPHSACHDGGNLTVERGNKEEEDGQEEDEEVKEEEVENEAERTLLAETCGLSAGNGR
jgi:hypothetical protein